MTGTPLDKLKGMFGHNDVPAGMTPEKFRQDLESALAESPTGYHLLRVATQQKIGIVILTAKGASGYIPENRAVYISLPPNLSTVPEESVLELGGYLRQAELQLLGYKNPTESMSSHDYTVAFDSKIIDSLAVMCKITSELYEKGHTNFLDALVRMGHGELYETYRKYGQGAELVQSYYNIVQETVTKKERD